MFLPLFLLPQLVILALFVVKSDVIKLPEKIGWIVPRKELEFFKVLGEQVKIAAIFEQVNPFGMCDLLANRLVYKWAITAPASSRVSVKCL